MTMPRVGLSLRLLALLLTALPLASCGDDDDDSANPTLPPRIVTADWLNRSLTVFDYERLIDASGDGLEARLSTIDLAPYPPGPLQLDVSPDGRHALVAVGPGFFTGVGGVLVGAPEIPAGGSLLWVNLETGEVEAELATQHTPMNAAVSPDGRRGYSANYGEAGAPGTSMTVVDLESLETVADIEVGPGPEQIALSPDGSFGMINAAGDGAVRTFSTANDEIRLSETLVISADPSNVAISPDGRTGLAANSRSPFGYSLIDLTDPLSPTLIATVETEGGVPYGAAFFPDGGRALVTVSTSLPAGLLLFDPAESPDPNARLIALPNAETLGFPLGVALDPTAAFAFTAIPGDNSLAVTDLSTGASQRITWLDATGPTYAAWAAGGE